MDSRTNEVIKIKFSVKGCQPCPSRIDCTRGKRRTITVCRQDHHLAHSTFTACVLLDSAAFLDTAERSSLRFLTLYSLFSCLFGLREARMYPFELQR